MSMFKVLSQGAIAAALGTATAAAALDYRSPLSITDARYGAVADGTDQKAHIQAAIAAAISAGSSLYPVALYVPPGVYSLASKLTLSAPITLYGPGTLKAISGTWSSGDGIIEVTGSNVTVDGLKLDQNNAISAGVCVKVDSGTDTVLRRLRTANVQAGFVKIVGLSVNTYVDKCKHVGRGYGVWVQDTDAGAYGLWVTDCHLEFSGTANSADGVEVNCPTHGFSDVYVERCHVLNYPILAGAAGIGIGLAKVTNAHVVSNIVEGCANDGIHAEAGSSRIHFSGNSVINCATDSSSSGGVALFDTDNSEVRGNIVDGASAAHGIIVWGLDGTQHKNVKVVENTVINCGKSGVLISSMKRVKVLNNIIDGPDLAVPGTFSGIHCRRVGAGTVDNTDVDVVGNTVLDGASSARSGVSVAAADTRGTIDNNILGGVVAATKIEINGNVSVRLVRNRRGTSRMKGTSTLVLSATSIVVSNNNSTGDASDVRIWPANATAATLLLTSPGVYVSASTVNSSFTITHPSAAGTEIFNYEIVA